MSSFSRIDLLKVLVVSEILTDKQNKYCSCRSESSNISLVVNKTVVARIAERKIKFYRTISVCKLLHANLINQHKMHIFINHLKKGVKIERNPVL